MAQDPLARNLLYFRLKKGLTQEDLGRLAKVDRSHVSRYETGTKVPMLPTLTRLAKALGTTPSKLLAA